MKRMFFLTAFNPAQIRHVFAHSRWKCPEPRSSSTSIKEGPCGDETNDFNKSGQAIEINPGPLRVVFEESIHHVGSPFRITLSGDGSDYQDTCVLLDHIPHNDDVYPPPKFQDPTTYTPYVITIDIPDVYCESCSLHLANPMTDKIGSDGSPKGIGCTDPNGTCFSVYHSCTEPFRISGSIPRSEYVCPDNGALPVDWPTQWLGDDGEVVDASLPGLYRREYSVWSPNDYTLQTAPLRYRQDAGGVC